MDKISMGKTTESWQVMSELLAVDSALELMGSGKRRRSAIVRPPKLIRVSADPPITVSAHGKRRASANRIATALPNNSASLSDVFILPEPKKPRKMKWAYASIFVLIFLSLGLGFGYMYLENNARVRYAEARYITQSLIADYIPRAEEWAPQPNAQAAHTIIAPASLMASSAVLLETQPEHEDDEYSLDYTYDYTEPVTPVLLTPMPRKEFLELRRVFGNDDIVGHLRIEGTAIDYIVVQGADNDFYLRRDIWQNRSSAGWIFLDYAVDLRGQDQNMTIYGHNVRNGAMFHNIRRYVSYSFFRENPIITFRTLYADYEWEIFAFYVAHINFPYTVVNFPNEATYAYMLDRFMSMSIHDSGITVSHNDRILTLSTCTNSNVNERFVLQARLIE